MPLATPGTLPQSERILELADRLQPQMVEWRRYLHQHPEISYHEFETTKWLVQRLSEMGYEVHRPIETGCVAVLKGREPETRVLALRADIDALAMEEEGEAKAAFFSKNPGAAHCCGHDAHTANMLGAARILMELKADITGTVALIFQPGEEKLPGGGRLLCESGFLQQLGVEAIYGLHSSPLYKPGEIGVIKGRMMARPD
ncbi:MAG: M20 metallopeptidase family protein, partial [Cyclonatronaceae bacterium]